MIIHTHGWKADRDREILMACYRSLLKHFYVKSLAEWELAKLTNHGLDRLCRDIYAKQPKKELRWYAEKMGHRPRTNEFIVRWFFDDLFHQKKKPRP